MNSDSEQRAGHSLQREILPPVRRERISALRLSSGRERRWSGGTEPGQLDILADLVRGDAVFELAKNICQLGYFDSLPLIVVHRGGALHVVDGNRRLTALMLLVAPNLSPSNSVADFQSLSVKMDMETLQTVPVTVFGE